MNMSQRERRIATIAGVVIGALVLYEYVIDPQVQRIVALDEGMRQSTAALDRANGLLEASRRASRQLSQMAGAGLRRSDAAAESELLNSVREWAQESRVTLSGVKRERTEREKDFNKVTFRASGSGGMGQIGRFLYRLQTASIPVRISDMTINSRKDGTDDLAITLSISTIYLAPQAEKPGARPGPAPARNAEVEL
jgi:hypothetical protein